MIGLLFDIIRWKFSKPRIWCGTYTCLCGEDFGGEWDTPYKTWRSHVETTLGNHGLKQVVHWSRRS